MSFVPRKRRLRPRVFAWLAVLVVVLGIASSLYTYFEIDAAGRQHILDRAYTMAEMLPEGGVAALSGSGSDLGMPEYESLKALLMDVRRVNSDVRFIYLIGDTEGGELFFFVDSEDVASEDYSPPGQVYDEAPQQMYDVFTDGVGRSDGPTADRWGVWISAYAPVYDAEGEVAGLLGIDLPADTFVSTTLTYAALPLLVSLFLVALLLAAQMLRAREERALEQKAEFLSVASHEIRTPLTGLRWALEDLLSSGQIPPGEAASSLTELHDVSTRLIERVNNLLEVTKLEQRGRAQKVETRMREFVEDIAKSFTLAAQQRHVRIVIDESLSPEVTARVDQDIMRHVFFNLLSNAIKYTKEGTEIRIAYAHRPGAHEFSVSDQGDGIPIEERERIFEGYHRSDTKVHIEGTGLGLYLVRKALRLVGGEVSVDSSKSGSRFLATLPE